MPTAVSVYLKTLFYTRSRKRDVTQKTAASILDCCSLRASIWQLEKDGKSPCFEFVLMPLPAVHGGVTWRGAAPRNSCFRHCVKTGTVQSIVVVIDLTAPRRRSIVRLHAASHSPPPVHAPHQRCSWFFCLLYFASFVADRIFTTRFCVEKVAVTVF